MLCEGGTPFYMVELSISICSKVFNSILVGYILTLVRQGSVYSFILRSVGR